MNNLRAEKYKQIANADAEEADKAWDFLFDRVIQKRLERNRRAIFSKNKNLANNFNQPK